MHNPYEIDYLSEQNRRRVARHVKESRAARKENEQFLKSGLMLRTRQAIGALLAIFFGS
jgi:hypothetical protein